MKFILPALFLTLMLNSCKTTTPSTEDSNTNTEATTTKTPVAETTYFIIGEGGGFTGLYTQYKVTNNGKVELYNEKEDSFTMFGNLPSATAKKTFAKLAELKLYEYEYYKPGNLNYRIRIPGDYKDNLIIWSDSNSPDEDVLIFFKNVMNEIEKLKK